MQGSADTQATQAATAMLLNRAALRLVEDGLLAVQEGSGTDRLTEFNIKSLTSWKHSADSSNTGALGR